MKKFLFFILLLTGFGTVYGIPPITTSHDDVKVEKMSCVTAMTPVTANFQTAGTTIVDPVPISSLNFFENNSIASVKSGMTVTAVICLKVGEIRKTNFQLNNVALNLNGNHFASSYTKGKGLVVSLS